MVNPANESRAHDGTGEGDERLRAHEETPLLGRTSQRENGSLEDDDFPVRATGLPLIDEDEQAERAKEPPVTWRSLPRKDQLLILTLARLSEPLTQTSLQSYMFYQLKSFNPSLPDSTISYQAGILQGAFSATQFITAIFWGRVADSEWGGRKRVILIGLLGTTIAALGFGFSHSFTTAVIFRSLGGALNGNVGVMRTMISEIIREKRFQSRAFLLLPMTFNVGVIIGPLLGGILADPVGTYPWLFGPGSWLGGEDGVGWMRRWPYALPNLVSAAFLFSAACAIYFGMEETLGALRDKPDYGLRIGCWIRHRICFGRSKKDYDPIPTESTTIARDGRPGAQIQPTSYGTTSENQASKPAPAQKLPFRRIFTRNVVLTFFSHATLAWHIGTFNNLWFVFLSTSRFNPKHPVPPSHHSQTLPFNFTGGLGLPPARIGMALAILGCIGLALQLIVYPPLSTRLGTVRCYRIFLLLFPVAYIIIPFLSLIPSKTPPPQPASGPLVWIAITGALVFVVGGRTFALPSSTILINNCCPHPSVLGTIHGIGQSVSSGTRTLGPMIGGWVFGLGLRIGVVGLAWWMLACIALAGAFLATLVREGSGHEILLPGEKEEDVHSGPR
ncbi:MFS transporter [Phyllosticta citricarpa]|uniref:MFS transporter n=1 Tax=Phyllosticta citricarpa TaxID=55181 RepID=A0ABR1MCN4_9PEZI